MVYSFQWPKPPPRIQSDTAPRLMEPAEKMRLRAAAFRATRVLPGPVGELCSRELLAAEEFGYMGDRSGLTQRLAEFVLAAPEPNATRSGGSTQPEPQSCR